MKKSVLWIVMAIVLLGIIAGATILYNKLSDQYQPQKLAKEKENAEQTDYTAPDFTVENMEGKEIKLSDMRGKPVVVNFWASWCPPCKSEMPSFEEMYKECGEEITFMMIDLTDGMQETVADGKHLIETKGYTFPVYFDVNMEAAMTYGASSIPQTFFINAKGELVTYAQGAIDKETLKRGIEMIR